MKKLILVLFLMLTVSGICRAEDATNTLDPGGYKGAKWGMGPKEVQKACPGKSFYWSGDDMIYKSNSYEVNVKVKFRFKDYKLVSVTIHYGDENKSQWLAYQKAKTIASKLYEETKQKYGPHIKLVRSEDGNLKYYYWDLDQTIIGVCSWCDFPDGIAWISYEEKEYGLKVLDDLFKYPMGLILE